MRTSGEPNAFGERALLVMWAVALLAAIVTTYLGAQAWLAGDGNLDISFVAVIVPPSLFIAAGAIGFLKERRDRIAALFSIALLVCAATNFVAPYHWMAHEPTKLLFEIPSNLSWFAIVVGLLVFPRGLFDLRWTKPAAAAVAAYLAWETYKKVGGEAFPLGERLSLYPTMIYFTLGTLALGSHLQRTTRDSERQQLGWMLIGLVAATLFMFAAFASAAVTDELLGFLHGLGIAALALSFMTAVLRQKFSARDSILIRSAYYAIVPVGAAAAFVAVDEAVQGIAQNFGGSSTGRAVIAAMVVSLAAPIKSAVTSWTDRATRTPIEQLKDAIPARIAELGAVASLQELLAETTGSIAQATGAGRVVIVLPGRTESEHLQPGAGPYPPGRLPPLNPHTPGLDNADRDFPIRIALRICMADACEPVGWLLLGPDEDGDDYGEDDVEALRQIAGPLARGIRSVELRERQEEWLGAIASASRRAADPDSSAPAPSA